MADKARLAAFRAVKRINEGAFSNLISVGALERQDRAFAESIVLGTVEHKITIEHVLSGFMSKKPKPEVQTLLMTGVTQILFMDRVPDNAVCDETVTIAKDIFGVKVSGFVNAVLRNICRKKDEIIESIENGEKHIKYSVNRELYELIESQYGEDTERIFEAFFEKTPVAIRINTLKSDVKSVIDTVGGEAIGETTVIGADMSKALKNIESGDFYVQGLASQKVVKLLGAKPDETVVDVCACPGGKSFGASLDMENKGRLIAFDIHKSKLPLIVSGAERLGIDIIEVDIQDSRRAREELVGTADRVICDVPCSGTGIIGNKPEIRYKSPKEFEGLYPTQRAIIKASASYLKVGGVMVYSTCSINKRENEEVINEFLAENDGFALTHMETCLPFGTEREGFFMARIIREK